MNRPQFKIREETRKRCKIFTIEEKDRAQFRPISLEFFHYLYLAKPLTFPVYLRVFSEVIEFIRPQEFSGELLDEVWRAMQKAPDGIEVCVRRADHPRFFDLIDSVRREKINRLLERFPELDRKTLDLYNNLSSASQMIIRGGIDDTVAAAVKSSAAYLVSNIIDSDAAIATLSKMISCDPTLYDHSASVSMFATVIATRLLPKPLSTKETEVVSQCALYHDTGKTCVPSCILNKPGTFTPEEFEVMKTHTTLGHEALIDAINKGARIDPLAARVALEHHEKFAGGGYPKGRKGKLETDEANGIHLFTRIVTISDVYSALLMKRVYKEAMESAEALKIMVKNATDYDPEIFPAFLRGVAHSFEAMKAKAGGGRIYEINDSGKIQQRKA